MDELLEALRLGNEEAVNELAKRLFITRDNRLNPAQMNEFERYAPCRIFLKQNGNGCSEILVRYNDKNFKIH